VGLRPTGHNLRNFRTLPQAAQAGLPAKFFAQAGFSGEAFPVAGLPAEACRGGA